MKIRWKTVLISYGCCPEVAESELLRGPDFEMYHCNNIQLCHDALLQADRRHAIMDNRNTCFKNGSEVMSLTG
jgi:hypothetical protein